MFIRQPIDAVRRFLTLRPAGPQDAKNPVERWVAPLLAIVAIMAATAILAPRGSWLEQMRARKPRMLGTVVLANKTARIIWVVLMKNENCREGYWAQFPAAA